MRLTLQRIGRASLCALLALALPTHAQSPAEGSAISALAADLAIDPASPNKTLAPRVVPNSGRLGWVPHDIDLSKWVSLSSQDNRAAMPPRRVELPAQLVGDAARGHEIAYSSKGNCRVCHMLPGDDWPGTVGNSLLHYKRNGYSSELIYQQVFDARIFNPNTVMPPFGTHGLLSEQDVRDLVAYLQSIE